MTSSQSRAVRATRAAASLLSFAFESGAGCRCGSLTGVWSL
jgi:hypothetical protein